MITLFVFFLGHPVYSKEAEWVEAKDRGRRANNYRVKSRRMS